MKHKFNPRKYFGSYLPMHNEVHINDGKSDLERLLERNSYGKGKYKSGANVPFKYSKRTMDPESLHNVQD